MSIIFMYVFFFQAEDGIRDTSVTGVQTCALPISNVKRGFTSATCFQHQSTLRLMSEAIGLTSFPAAAATAPDMREFISRSEERRVGKECRSRWARYQ